MSKFKCRCGAPTDNDQSFIIPEHITGGEPARYEVHRCDKCDKRFHQELEWESKGETLLKEKITCPYCGYEYEDYDGYAFDAGNHPEVACEHCGRKFDLEVREIRTYSTKRSLCEMPDDYDPDEEAEA